MNEEALLFNTFNSLMQTRTKKMDGLKEEGKSNTTNSYNDLANKIKDDIQSLEEQSLEKEMSILEHSESICKGYRQDTLDTEIPDEREMKDLAGKSGRAKKEHLIKLLEKFGRFYVLDITREITLLRQIKDIQDELEMMKKIFAEQKEVLEAMDRIVNLMTETKYSPRDSMQAGTLDKKSNSRRFSSGSQMEGSHGEEPHDSPPKREPLKRAGTTFSGSTISVSHECYQIEETKKQNDSMTKSMIWEFRHQKNNLPLRTVQRFSEQIKKMNQRAKRAHDAVCPPFLSLFLLLLLSSTIREEIFEWQRL